MVYHFQKLVEDISPQFKERQRLLTHEILDYLNRTQDRYIQMKYLSGTSFKENVYRISSFIDDFPALINLGEEIIVFADVEGMGSATESFDAPADFLAYMRGDVNINRVGTPYDTTATAEWVPMEEVDYNDLDNILTTPFNKPLLEKPLFTMIGNTNQSVPTTNNMIIIHDTYTELLGVRLTYMRKPQDINMVDQDCELADYLHEEIVKLSVSMFIDEYKTKFAKH